MKSTLLASFCLTYLATIQPLVAATFTWDANTGTSGAQDGAGIWRPVSSNTNWWDGTTNVVWVNDVNSPNNAIFGANSGAAGTVSISPSGTTNSVGAITFNAPGSGNYTISGSDSSGTKLNLVNTPTITVAAGVGANITAILLGTCYIKSGPGVLTNNPNGNNNFNSGTTVLQDGTLVIGGSSSSRTVIPGDFIMTNFTTAILGNSEQIANTSMVTIGAFSTLNMNGKSETISSLVLDGGAVTQTGTETLTVSGNVDARGGTISGGTGKMDAATLTKTTAGLVTLACRGSSAASGGLTTTIVNQGTLALDYSQNNSKLKDSGSLTINGGTLVLTFGSHAESVAAVTLVNGIISNSFGTASLSLPSPANYDMQTGAVYTVLGGTGGLVKSTPGVVSLNAANTFSGDSRIGAGSLTLGAAGALSKSTLDLNTSDAGSLSFGTLTSASLGGLKGSRNLSLQNGSSAAVSADVGNNNQSTTYTGTIGGSGTFNKVGNGTFFLDGTISAAAVNVSAGKLAGNGTIAAPVTVQSGGTLSPGDSVGRLNIGNVLTLSAGGNVIIEIDKTAGTNDLVAGITGITYGGTLSISNLNTALAAGDSFKIFDSATYTPGSFDAIVPATPGMDLVWDTSRLAIDGTLKVINANQSAGIHIDKIASLGTNIIINGAGGSAGVSYALLISTNVMLPASDWTVLSSNVFDGAGNFSETNGVAGQPKLFFMLRSP
ncbi:MAG TPA: hypothetical protein VLT36_08325 [Candidatus Dormibacteraeota bacterium]|nr:hypothetical protein [Candidatus Dormibacteraeota bacterium]